MFKKSDAEWQKYWDELMQQSDNPVPWGTIVEEKPLHGELSTTEDAKKHDLSKTKKRRFKVNK